VRGVSLILEDGWTSQEKLIAAPLSINKAGSSRIECAMPLYTIARYQLSSIDAGWRWWPSFVDKKLVAIKISWLSEGDEGRGNATYTPMTDCFLGASLLIVATGDQRSRTEGRWW